MTKQPNNAKNTVVPKKKPAEEPSVLKSHEAAKAETEHLLAALFVIVMLYFGWDYVSSFLTKRVGSEQNIPQTIEKVKSADSTVVISTDVAKTYGQRLKKLESDIATLPQLVSIKNVRMPKDPQTLYLDKRLTELDTRMSRIEEKLNRLLEDEESDKKN